MTFRLTKRKTKMTTAPLILLVEDDRIAQIVAKKILEGIGCTVEVASTGEDAIKMASEKDYALIFTDIGLGSMDGYTVTSEIRKMSNANSRVPIIALTAHSEEEVEHKAAECEMSYILTKPMSTEGAKQMIALFLENESTDS